MRDLINLSHEPPVQDFISAVHRNSAASGLFIQAIQSRCDNLTTVRAQPLICLRQPSVVSFSHKTSLSGFFFALFNS